MNIKNVLTWLVIIAIFSLYKTENQKIINFFPWMIEDFTWMYKTINIILNALKSIIFDIKNLRPITKYVIYCFLCNSPTHYFSLIGYDNINTYLPWRFARGLSLLVQMDMKNVSVEVSMHNWTLYTKIVSCCMKLLCVMIFNITKITGQNRSILKKC